MNEGNILHLFTALESCSFLEFFILLWHLTVLFPQICRRSDYCFHEVPLLQNSIVIFSNDDYLGSWLCVLLVNIVAEKILSSLTSVATQRKLLSTMDKDPVCAVRQHYDKPKKLSVCKSYSLAGKFFIVVMQCVCVCSWAVWQDNQKQKLLFHRPQVPILLRWNWQFPLVESSQSQWFACAKAPFFDNNR